MTQELFPSSLWRISGPGLHCDLLQKHLLSNHEEEPQRVWEGSGKPLVILDLLVHGCWINNWEAEPNSQMPGTPGGPRNRIIQPGAPVKPGLSTETEPILGGTEQKPGSPWAGEGLGKGCVLQGARMGNWGSAVPGLCQGSGTQGKQKSICHPPSFRQTSQWEGATLLQPEPGGEGEAEAGTKHSPFLSARRKICKTKHSRAQCGSRERRAAEQ